MQVHGAVIREQGQTFAVVKVKEYVVQNSSEANDAIDSFRGLFPGMPIVLAGQSSGGRFTYFGRQDMAQFLASISPSRIPWKVYTFS